MTHIQTHLLGFFCLWICGNVVQGYATRASNYAIRPQGNTRKCHQSVKTIQLFMCTTQLFYCPRHNTTYTEVIQICEYVIHGYPCLGQISSRQKPITKLCATCRFSSELLFTRHSTDCIIISFRSFNHWIEFVRMTTAVWFSEVFAGLISDTYLVILWISQCFGKTDTTQIMP